MMNRSFSKRADYLLENWGGGRGKQINFLACGIGHILSMAREKKIKGGV